MSKNRAEPDNCSFRFVILDNTREIGQNIFSTGKMVFLKNLSFQQPVMCYRNDPISHTNFAKTPCEA